MGWLTLCQIPSQMLWWRVQFRRLVCKRGLPEYVATASLFRAGWNMNSSAELTFRWLFLPRLKKGLNHTDPEHLECYFRT